VKISRLREAAQSPPAKVSGWTINRAPSRSSAASIPSFARAAYFYGLIANWPEASLRTLVKRNHDLLRRNIVFAQARGFV